MNRRRGLLAGLGAALGLAHRVPAQPATRLPSELDEAIARAMDSALVLRADEVIE